MSPRTALLRMLDWLFGDPSAWWNEGVHQGRYRERRAHPREADPIVEAWEDIPPSRP